MDGRTDDKMIEVLFALVGLRFLIKMLDSSNKSGRRKW